MKQKEKKVEENKIWTIYRHTNKINGRCYIGQTSYKNPENRWKNGEGYKGQYFYEDIKKYGWDNFVHEILETNIKSQEEADNRESYYITKNNSNIYHPRGKGYNQNAGGIHYWKSRMSIFTEKEKDIFCNWFRTYHAESIKDGLMRILPKYEYKLIYTIAYQVWIVQLYRSVLDVMRLTGNNWDEVILRSNCNYNNLIDEIRKKMSPL